MRPGLSRIKAFLKRCGDPQNSFKTVHIAGTNGKGSTAAILSTLISASGLRTGLYISPHILDITERISVDGCRIKREKLDGLARRYSSLANNHSLTFFEFMTALAYIYFASRKIDVAVLETGLGGRFDATNVIEDPLVSVITDIDLDHTAVLGDTVKSIAAEKAGIIKKGRPLVNGAESKPAAGVILQTAGEKKAPVYSIFKDFDYLPLKTDWRKGVQHFRYNGIHSIRNVSLGLLGQHQLKNFSLAMAAFELLKEQGVVSADRDPSKKLAALRWPARFQPVRSNGRTIVIDGAHNPGAMRRFVSTWKTGPWSGKDAVFIFGMLKDKQYAECIRILSDTARKVIIAPVDSPRNAPALELFKIWKEYLPESRIIIADSVRNALTLSGKSDAAVVGSLYLAGETLKILSTGKGH